MRKHSLKSCPHIKKTTSNGNPQLVLEQHFTETDSSWIWSYDLPCCAHLTLASVIFANHEKSLFDWYQALNRSTLGPDSQLSKSAVSSSESVTECLQLCNNLICSCVQGFSWKQETSLNKTLTLFLFFFKKCLVALSYSLDFSFLEFLILTLFFIVICHCLLKPFAVFHQCAPLWWQSEAFWSNEPFHHSYIKNQFTNQSLSHFLLIHDAQSLIWNTRYMTASNTNSLVSQKRHALSHPCGSPKRFQESESLRICTGAYHKWAWSEVQECFWSEVWQLAIYYYYC